MNRRDTLLALVALGAAAGPRVATPQTSPRIPTLGFLALVSAPTKDEWDRTPFAIRLKELGWVEGKNIRIERAFAEKNAERLSVLAADLVRKQVDVIYTLGPQPAFAAAQATKTIPVVFFGPTFPIEMGLIDSYARPGRNVTGVAWSAGVEVYVKLLSFVKELVPAAARVASLTVPTARPKLGGGYYPGATPQLEAAAKKMGFELRAFDVAKPEDFDGAFKAIQAWRPQAFYTTRNPVVSPEIQKIVDFANANRLPSLFDNRDFAVAGGLFSYGPEITSSIMQAVNKIDRILRGAKPADLPVEMPTRYEMVINRKTATTLGIKIPQSLLARADEVIQ